jgi:protein TonB
MKRRPKFKIWHGFVCSLAIHSALGMPFVLFALASPPDDDDPTLVIELQGALANTQSQQQLLQETKGETQHEDAEVAKPAEAAPEHAPENEQTTDTMSSAPLRPESPNVEPSPSSATAPVKEGAANNVVGTQQQQEARRIQQDEERDRLNQYVKVLAKKIHANLVYPDRGRRSGTATVSFAILSNGQIRPETLKIVESSGQAELDASALSTIRGCVPFAPPPKEITVTIAVEFRRNL